MQSVDDRRVLITGANGIVGRAVTARLAAAGVEHVAVVSPSSWQASPSSVRADLALEFPELGRFSDFVHLAAALPHDARYCDEEVAGRLTRRIDANVLEAAQTQNARIIYASTCSLYDPTSASTKDEKEAVLRVDTPYRSAKRDCELKLLASGQQHAILRLSAPYGAGMFAGTVLSRFISLARSRAEIEVWGTGTREQNFIHASDVADLVFSALITKSSGLFNVASEPTTMLKLAKLVVAAVGSGSYRLNGRIDPLDGECARYDTTKTRELFHWEPKISLAYGIALSKDLEFRI